MSSQLLRLFTSNEFFDYNAKYNGQVEEITPARMSDETAKRVAADDKFASMIFCMLMVSFVSTILSQG